MLLCFNIYLFTSAIFQFVENVKRKLPPLPDYGNFLCPKDQVTRNSSTEPCGCSVCSIAREKVGGKVPLFKGKDNPLGRSCEKPDSPTAETLLVCNKCFSIMQKQTYLHQASYGKFFYQVQQIKKPEKETANNPLVYIKPVK